VYEGPTTQWPITLEEARRALQEERFSKARTIAIELLSRNPQDWQARQLLNDVEATEQKFKEKAWRGGTGSKIAFGPWTIAAIFCAWQGLSILWYSVAALGHGTGLITTYEQPFPIPLTVTSVSVNMTPLAGLFAAIIVLGLGVFCGVKAYLGTD